MVNMLREHEDLHIEAQAVVEIGQMRPLPEHLDALEWGKRMEAAGAA